MLNPKIYCWLRGLQLGCLLLVVGFHFTSILVICWLYEPSSSNTFKEFIWLTDVFEGGQRQA
jgi:hypothetical protein